MVTSFKNTIDILLHTVEKFPNQIAISAIVAGETVSYTYKQIFDEATKNAKALLKIGIHKNENIGIITSNRIEWSVLDFAIAMIGAVNVTLFPNYDKKDFIHIINDSQIKHLFIGNKIVLQFLNTIIKDIPSVEHIYSFDEINGTINFKKYLGDEQLNSFDKELEKRLSEVNGNDIYTIFYTSGTGGTPKGVLMPHQSIVNAAVIMGSYLNLNNNDTAISFLSISHAYERGHYFAYLYNGVKLYYAEMIKSPLENIQKYEPSVFTSVPLLLQKIQEAVISTTANKPKHKFAIEKAYSYEFGDETQSESFIQYTENFYKYWKIAFGKNIRTISCAGAPLPDYLFRFICAIDIKLQEIYGLSECFAVTCGRFPDKVKFGTVGAIGNLVEIKISDEGEVILKSPCMMKGFYNLPEHTKEVLDNDGWFKTGDKGEIIEGKFLKLTGRKKDIFKIASGMYITPTKIEQLLNSSSLILNSLVFEKNGKVAVLIVADSQAIEQSNNQLSYNIADVSSIKKLLKQEINRLYNDHAMPAEQIDDIIIDEDTWSVDGGQLTPTMKVKREVILKSKNIIE